MKQLISRNFVSVTENFSLFDSRHYVSKLPRFLLFPPFVNCGFPLVVENDALYFFYFLVHQKETTVKNGVLWKFLFSIHHHELNKILYFGIDTKSIGALQEIFQSLRNEIQGRMSSTEFWHLLEEKNKGEGLRRFKVNLSPLSSSSWNARRCFISLGKSSFGIKRRRQQRNCSTSIMAFALLVATKDGGDSVSDFVIGVNLIKIA